MPVPFARLFAVLLFLLAACGPNAAPATTSASPTSTAASSPAAFPATVSDFQDRSITIPKRPERIVSIGPVTSQTLREAGLEVDVEAARHDVGGLVQALLGDAEAHPG